MDKYFYYVVLGNHSFLTAWQISLKVLLRGFFSGVRLFHSQPVLVKKNRANNKKNRPAKGHKISQKYIIYPSLLLFKIQITYRAFCFQYDTNREGSNPKAVFLYMIFQYSSIKFTFIMFPMSRITFSEIFGTLPVL